MARMGAGVLCAVGLFAVAALWALRSPPSTDHDRADGTADALIPAVGVEERPPSRDVVSALGSGPMPMALDGPFDLTGPTAPDDRWSQGVRVTQGAVAPATLPPPKNAAPIDATVRSLLEEELPQATADERRIWAEELQGLSPDMIRELLRLRRRIGSATGDRPGGLPEFITPPSALEPGRPAAPRPVPLADHSELTDPLQSYELAAPTRNALHRARAVVLNNLANAATPGFKRQRVVLADLPYDVTTPPKPATTNDAAPANETAVGRGLTVARTPLDLSQGKLRHTGERLHLAIAGAGFLQVKVGDTILYTRAGQLTVEADGRLAVLGADVAHPLEPPVRVPDNARTVRIAADGTIRARLPGNESPTPIGQLVLARFANAAALMPQGECLYAATPSAGAAAVGVPGAEGRGRLRQRFLERSNVDVEVELTELQRLERIEQALRRAGEILSRERDAP